MPRQQVGVTLAETAAAGAIVTVLFGKLLKLLLNTKRPSSSNKHDEDNGMPSSHATALTYWLTAIWIYTPSDWNLRGPLCWLATLYVMAVLFARVALQFHHTLAQVVVGVALGGACASLAAHCLALG